MNACRLLHVHPARLSCWRRLASALMACQQRSWKGSRLVAALTSITTLVCLDVSVVGSVHLLQVCVGDVALITALVQSAVSDVGVA
jgi:hypothetical protein